MADRAIGMGRLGWRYGAFIGVLMGAVPAAAHAADLLFQAEAQTLTGTCTRQAVRLEGNHNTVTLTGPCGSLLVKGLANTVRLAIVAGGSIRVEGGDNRLHYSSAGSGPVIETFGPNNEVIADGETHAAVPPPPPPAPNPISAAPPKPAPPSVPPASAAAKPLGALELTGDDTHRMVDCAGRDAIVTGNRSAYIISGSCKSLSVTGDLITVQALMRPGARIRIDGRGSVVSWATQGRGKAPDSIVHGAGSRVQRALPGGNL
ncbi:DUF3060 domain-containing protein [Acidisphaera sp. L21]|uniref:DUF3060 domain-containing protein n=1 Tax=Acidisphaera sp. L21 TaxID=1641851 RepID=UPI00131D44C5|nr:DUF3060 domain-containing protein [Acidisphaera sp. L21]